MTLHISHATPDDLEDLAKILAETETYYGEAEPYPAIIENIKRSVFGDPPDAYVILAHNQDSVVGFAAYSYLWPAVRSTCSLFLKELYVSADHRNHGIGRRLMEELAEIASSRHCSRIEWMTENENRDAQEFYRQLGHTPSHGKLHYRID